ncbi:MAG: Na/Pi cotransporter family protein [Magnetococcales bacterium]|nr:Na/Pi cotransporter family protein [Magnetococcales bacterium]
MKRLIEHPRRYKTLTAFAMTMMAGLCVPALARASVEAVAGEIDFTALTIHLLGGLSIFLFGMEMMNRALKAVAGDGMSTLLRRLTSNRVMGMITGTFVTAVVQSSSVTTVMLVGFVTAGLMTFAQTLGVILGADIGTTITTQIVAFKVTKWAPLLITSGFALSFLGRSEQAKQYGKLILGMGLIFFGMGQMSLAMEPLRSYQPFIDIMASVSNPVIGILVATLFTGLIQASAATMGVVLVLAMHGLIDLEGGIAMTIGANIGTCVTAGLAAIGKPREAVRVAVAHVSFKIAGALLVVGFIPQFADLVRSISPVADTSLATPQELLAATLPRQVANAHTLFNVGLALVFLPATGLFARFCYWVLPEKSAVQSVEAPQPVVSCYQPEALESVATAAPESAIQVVRHEVADMTALLEQMTDDAFNAIVKGDVKQMRALRKQDDVVDEMFKVLTHYLAELSCRNLPVDINRHVTKITNTLVELESVGDIISQNLFRITKRLKKQGQSFSESEINSLRKFHEQVLDVFRSATSSFNADNARAAEKTLNLNYKITAMDDQIRHQQIQALKGNTAVDDLGRFSLLTDVQENLRRIHHASERVARLVLEHSQSHKQADHSWVASATDRPALALVN